VVIQDRRRPQRQRLWRRLPGCVSEALLDPDFWPRLLAAPALGLLLAAGAYQSLAYALAAAAVAGAALALQAWLKRLPARRERRLLRRWESGDPIADDQRHPRRPSDRADGGPDREVPDADT
jgi:hypothetical protein